MEVEEAGSEGVLGEYTFNHTRTLPGPGAGQGLRGPSNPVRFHRGAAHDARLLGFRQFLDGNRYGAIPQPRARLVGPQLHEDKHVDIKGIDMEPSRPSGLDIVYSAPGAGVFRVRPGKLRLGRGLQMVWKTESGKQ